MEGTNMDRIKAKREKRDPLNEEEDGQRCYIRTKKNRERERESKSRLKRLATCKSALKGEERRRKCVSPE